MKRDVSILIPYKKANGEIFVFLERRSKTAKRLADWFGFWGGGIDAGETSEQAVLREIKEELSYEPVGCKHFKDFEFGVLKSIKHIYFLEVDNTFESKINYSEESQYGQWFNQEQIESEKLLIEDDKIVLREFFKLDL